MLAGEQEWINDRLIRMATRNGYGEANSFIPIPHALRKCIRLNSAEKDVLYHLLYSMNDKGYCFPAYKTIANELFLSESTVTRAIKKLERMYFIRKEEVVGSSNRYYIDMLEKNPYLYLTGFTTKFKRSFQPNGIQKGLCKTKVIEAVNQFVKEDKYEVFAQRLYNGEDTETVLNEYLEQLRQYVTKNTGVSIRTIEAYS